MKLQRDRNEVAAGVAEAEGSQRRCQLGHPRALR